MSRSWNDRVLTAVMVGRFVRARWGLRFRSRERFEAWQERRIARFLRRIRSAPFYAAAQGASPDVAAAAAGGGGGGGGGGGSGSGSDGRLVDLPVVDKSTLLEHFDELNTRGVRLADALGVALEAERTRDFAPLVAGDLTVGLSSGTSGRRGAFLVSPRERALWAGTILARVLDRRSVGQLLRFWGPPVRIAFFLRAGGNLYESVASSRIRFAFHDLTEPFDDHVEALERSAAAGTGADVLVAPASVLGALAERALAARDRAERVDRDRAEGAGRNLAGRDRAEGAGRDVVGSDPVGSDPAGRGDAGRVGGLRIRPRLVISVAEVLEPATARAIRAAWGHEPRQVYQATEGLLAITCSRGSLHLNEESVHVEREWLDEERTRFTPVVTDFDRRTQIIARYRLDDVLRVSPDAVPCACGRVTTVLAGVDGRADAVLLLPHTSGRELVEIFPDVLRQAMATASDSYADWRIRQRGLDLHVSLAGPSAGAETRVADLLGVLLQRARCRGAVRFDPWIDVDPAQKVRRIVREHAVPLPAPGPGPGAGAGDPARADRDAP